MDDAERLGRIEDALDRLRLLAGESVVLVEGRKDAEALRAVGVDGEFLCVQSSGGPLRAAEALWREGRCAVVLTDWDRRGGSLAADLRRHLGAMCVPYDDAVRRDLALLCSPYAKDVESLDSVVAVLRSRAGVQPIKTPGAYRGAMGAIIVFEGIDGSGKSTVCRRVAEALRSEGLRAEATAEPTREGVGAFIRSGSAGRISQRAESLLFTADRYEHTAAMTKSASEGAVVLCDRYYASTIAYQSAKLDGDSADLEWLMGLCEPFVPVPDAVILLDVDPERSLERVCVRGEEGSKFENLPFLTQVRGAYLELADRYGYEVVDSSGTEDEVFDAVMRIVREVL